MPSHFLLWVILAPVVVIAGVLYLNRRARFRERTIADLTPFFQKIDWDLVNEIFDAEREAIAFYHSGNPRRERRRRMELVRENIGRMSKNTLVVLQVANTEHACMTKWPESYNVLQTARINNLRQAATLFYDCSQCVLAEIWFWMLISSFRWLRISVPSAARLRYFGKLDLLKAYEQVRDAAVEYGRIFGEEPAEEIRASI